jgi:TonB family protein
MRRKFQLVANCGLVTAALLMASALCDAAHQSAAAAPAQQASAALEPISSPEMDALAAKLAEKIGEAKVTSVVVVGGGSPTDIVSEFGASLRDALNESLARQAAGVHVFSAAEVGATLKQNRVSAGMICSIALADWIAKHVQADAAVTVQLDQIIDNRTVVTVQLVDERKKKYNPRVKGITPFGKLDRQITLTEAEVNAATLAYKPQLTTAVPKSGTEGLSMAMCKDCPKPPYSEEGRRLLLRGSVFLSVTVRPDGYVDDVLVERPLGHGMDGTAVDGVLKWKFKPSVDGQMHAVPTRVMIEIAFSLY